MRKLAPLSTVLVLGTLGALAAGCPVWDTNGHDDRDHDADVDAGTDRCSSDSQCPGGYCNVAAGQCISSPRCTQPSECPAGYACDGRGACVPGCSVDADCTRLASGLVCDTASRRCAPSGRCTADAQCTGGQVCLGGSCQPRSNLCQFDYQCSAGQACVDGRCVAGCTPQNAATTCAAGQVCTNGRCAYPTGGDCGGRCTARQLCVSGACLQVCAADAECGSGNMCDHGVCRVDTRPRPFCTGDAQCNRGSVCYNGACRLTCSMHTDAECRSVDSQFDRCLQVEGRYFCTSSLEQSPECARSSQCAMGRACVNARCI